MKLRILSCVLLSLAACGCSSAPSARIMSADEGDVVGNRRAGAATYDRLIGGTVEKLLKGYSAARNDLGDKVKVVSLEIENASGEEIGDWTDQLYELIDTSINTSGRFQNVSIRFVRQALRENRLRSEDLFIPAKRRLFLQTLEANGDVVQALIFPKLTRGSTGGGSGVTQRNYALTLELVDVKTGESDKETTRLRKEYSK